jgi:hypothetical protein
MPRPALYKKHIKHASDLVWTPTDDSTQAIHWKFDEQYSVVQREQFAKRDLPSVLQRAFATPGPRPFPVPQFEPTTASDSDTFGAITESAPSARSFLPFPDGFWSDLHTSERHVVVPGPIGFF